MVKAGQYAEYPLPVTWLPVLARLRPCRTLPVARPLPSLGHLIDAALLPLDDRQRQMLWGRLGLAQTLQELGDLHGVTREQVRQIEKAAQRKLLQNPQLRLVLGGVWAAFERAGTLLIDVSGASSGVFTQATPDQLWSFVYAVWEFSRPGDFISVRLEAGLWLYRAEALPGTLQLNAALSGPGQPARFLNAATLADLLDVGESDLLTFWPACPRLAFTAGELFASESWTLPQWTEAVAAELATAGFPEWHFSEMARALEVVAPQHYPALVGRNVAAVLSRPDVTAFEYAGRKGCWRLKAYGDGHADNQAAIRAVLDAHDLPLHTRELQERLKVLGRDIVAATVYALLERENDFYALGGGVFGVAGRAYPDAYPEEAWILNLFADNAATELPADQVHWAAHAAGLEPWRLEAVGRFSAHFRWWQHRAGEAQYLTADRARTRQFQSWFERRHERVQPPAPELLLYGLRAAYGRRDSATLVGTQAYLHLHGLAAPEEARPWLSWALGYGETGGHEMETGTALLP